MDNLHQERMKCLTELDRIFRMPTHLETHLGGKLLGLCDWLMEEAIILGEIRARMTDSEWSEYLMREIKGDDRILHHV